MGLMMVLVVHGMQLVPLPPGVPVLSRGDCVYRCYHQRSCSSVIYDGSTKKCHLSTEVYFDSDLMSSPNNMQYFVWRRDGCDKGYTWYRSLGLCFKIYTSTETWFQANHTCHQDSGHLIKVDSAGINAWMNKISESHPADVWFGGFQDDLSGQWTWTDGSAISRAYWGEGQPDHEQQKCLGIYKDHKNVMRWNDFRCTSTDVPMFVCQLPLKEEPYC